MNIHVIRQLMASGKTIFDLPLRVTYYARVSTEKDAQRNSLENQIQYYTALISDNPHWIPINGYVDEGISGTSTRHRAQFLRMIEDAKAHRFDFIITKEISRFSRSTLDSILYTQQLLSYDVGVLFQNDHINTLDPDSEFRLVVMAGVAQDEVRKLSDRLKFGFHQAIRNGHVLGNDRIWGYDKQHSRLYVNSQEAAAVRMIFDLYGNQGWGMRRIARALTEQGYTSALGNPFNPRTIQNILTNPKYTGWYCGNKTRSLDYRTHRTTALDPSEWVCHPDPQIPALVSEALWERANARYQARRKSSSVLHRTTGNRYPYSGLIQCEVHHCSFHRAQLPSGTIQWRCREYRLHGSAGCSLPSVTESQLNQILAFLFQQLFPKPHTLIADLICCISEALSIEGAQLTQQQITHELTTLAKKKSRLLELHLDGMVDAQTLMRRTDAWDHRIQQLQQAQQDAHNPTQNFAVIKHAAAQALHFSTGILPAIVAAPVQQITVLSTSTTKQMELILHLKSGRTCRAQCTRTPFTFKITDF